MTHRALLLAITAAIALTLLPLPSASATGDSGIGDTHTPAEGTHACVVYIDRDVVPDESFLGYIAEYSSLLNGASSPWEDDFLTICGTRSLDFVPCPNAIDNSVCHGGEFTHFIPVRSHDATINGTRPSNLPATLSEILRPIDAPPSPHMPDELFAYPSKVLPGGELGVDHLFVFFIGVHPLLVWEAAAAMIHRDVPLSDFTFVNHPIIAPSSEFKDLVPPIESGGGNVGVDDDDWDEDNTSFLNSGDISSSSSNGDEEELSSKFDSSSESSMPEYLAFAEIEFHNSLQMYDFKTPISPGYKHTFPIVFIDPDPLTHGYLVGVLAYGLLSTIDIGVAQWEGDDYSRAFLSGVSHGIRSHCQSCNVYSIVLPRNDNDIVASFQTADLQTGGIPRSLIMPPFPHYMQSNRAMLERMLNTYTRPIPWDAIFLHNVFYIYAIQEHTRCLESSTVIGLLQYFSKDTLIRGGRTHGYWYSKPRDVPLVCLLSLYDSYRIPEMVSRAFSDLMDNKVEFPFDWRTGLALPTSTLTGYQHLGSAVGLSWNALGAIALTISSDVVLLLADDLSSMALYNPMRHSVMEIRYFIESAAELAFTNGFSVTQSNGTVIVSGGSTLPRATGPSTDMFAFDINGLGGDVDTLCNTFSNSCIGSTRTIGLLPIPLYGHTSVYHPPYLYIHGGTHRETGLLQNVLYRAILPSSGYPSGSLEWEALNTEGSIPRSYHTSMLFSQQGNASDYIYFLGSSQSSTLLSWYSIKEDTWGSFDLQSPIGSRPCMNAVESSVFAMSGSTMYRFEPSTQTLFQQKQNVLSSSHSMSCVTIDAPNGFIIPSTMYWQEDKQLHETDAIEDDSSTDSSDSDAVFATLHINAKKSRTTPDREKNIVVVLVLQSGSSDSISTMTFPRNLQCSTGNQILSPMGTSCVDCKPGYVANGDVCTPCESFAAKDSAGFTVYCPSTLPSSVHWAIIAGPIAVTVLLAVAVLVLWHLRRRRRDVAHQRRCNAPSSGGVFVVYFWVDKAPQLWKERSNDMAEVSSQLVQLLRCVLARHECYEVVNCGDSGLFTGRDAERVLRASSEAWLQVAQRQWCVGKLRANFLLHYDDFQCVETEVDSEYSGFWRWVESGRRARTAMTLVGGGIQHLQRTAMYVQGIVGSARFLGEYARARGDELAPLAAYIDSVDGSCRRLKPLVPLHAQWEDDVVFSVVDPALDAALAPEPAFIACAHRLKSCMDALLYRGRDTRLVTRSQKVGLDVVREHAMLSECGTAMGTNAPTAEEARRRYPLVGLVKGDTVLTTYEVLLQGDVAPRHVRLPLRCFEVNAMMTVTPRCKHSPECATDETFARLLCDRDALTAEERLFVSRYQCEHCRRRVPKRVRCCRLEVVRPMEQAVPNRCPFFRLSVSTHRVTMAARAAEDDLQHQRLELVRRARALDSRPTMLSNVPPELWPTCQSVTSATSSVAADNRDVFDEGILCHPMVDTGLLPAELFVHVVRIVEKLYDALLAPLRADERLEVAESVRQQMRLFTNTYPDSPERSREVALRLLQVMDMLHVKDIVERITNKPKSSREI